MLRLALAAMTVAGCGQDPIAERRYLEMQDHELDALTALHAVGEADLHAVRAAGARLARPDDFGELPASARERLDRIRTHGTALAEASSLEEASARVIAMTSECNTCHAELAVPTPDVPKGASPLQLAFEALVWHDLERWTGATTALGGAAGEMAGAKTWDARRAALARTLTSGS